MKASHLSNKEFSEQCRTSSMQCKKAKQCFVHEGRSNLKKIRNSLRKINPNHMGWKTGIKWNIEKGGFIDTLLNFHYLREELLQTKREINKFNENRLKLPALKERIDLLLETKSKESPPRIVKLKKPGISTRNPKSRKIYTKPFTSKTIERLRMKRWENECRKDPLYRPGRKQNIFKNVPKH